MAGIRLLQRHNVEFHVITGAVGATAWRSRSLRRFYLVPRHRPGLLQCRGIRRRPCVRTVRRGRSARAASPLPGSLLAPGARKSGAFSLIREIDGMLPRIFRPRGSRMGNEQVAPFGMLNVACNGDVSSFSPELLGLRTRDTTTSSSATSIPIRLEQMQASAPMRLMARGHRSPVWRSAATAANTSRSAAAAPDQQADRERQFRERRARGSTSFF